MTQKQCAAGPINTVPTRGLSLLIARWLIYERKCPWAEHSVRAGGSFLAFSEPVLEVRVSDDASHQEEDT